MSRFELSRRANARLDEIYVYGFERWGEAQAQKYLNGLFDCFDEIARGDVISRPIPAEFGVDGYYRRHERHFIYWRRLANGAVGIVTILHEGCIGSTASGRIWPRGARRDCPATPPGPCQPRLREA